MPLETLPDTGLDAVDIALGVVLGAAGPVNAAAGTPEFAQRIREYGRVVNQFPVDLLLRLVMRQGLVLDALGWPGNNGSPR
jgi:hypothetical protein